MIVCVQRWTESECGWGQRPDGLSIHFSEDQHTEYIKAHEARLVKRYGLEVPPEYDFPDGRPYMAKIIQEKLDDDGESIVKCVLANKSFRTYKNSLPWLEELTL